MDSLYNFIRQKFSVLNLNVHKHYLPENPQTLMEKFRWLLACGLLICPRYRFIAPRLMWWNDEKFNNYLNKFDELYGMNTYRRWNLKQFLKMSSHIDGDTVECGCYTGASSYLICQSNKTADKKHFIFDSFEGLSDPSNFDGTHWKKNDLATSEATLHNNLNEFKDTYQAYKGWIPNLFFHVAERRFSFVHIDVDLYEPTRDSIEFFYPRMNSGGIMVCDDYGFTSCPGATKAIDDFMTDKPENVISLATGSCFFIKL